MSHVNMSAFWSGTDIATIKELGEQDWCVATVFNKKAEYRSALCFSTTHPVLGAQSTMVDELPTTIGSVQDAGILKSWSAELKAKVKSKEYAPTKDSWWSEGYGASTYTPRKQTQHEPTLLTGSSTDAWGNTLEERGEYFKHGFTGMGLHVEARYLGMTAVDLYNKCMSAEGTEYEEIEDKLTMALYQGVLR